MSNRPCPAETDGEAQNPGPIPTNEKPSWLVAGTTNVTAMTTQFENIMSIPADILGCQEVRLPEPGQVDMARELYEKGWNVTFGKPLERKPGSNRIPPGGVAIMAKRGLNLQRVPPRCEDGYWLWNTTRFCHGIIEASVGVIHVFCVYGHTNAWNNRAQRDRNEELLSRLVRYMSSLGDVPIILLGDFNTAPEHSAVLSTEIGQGNLFDISAIFAQARGEEPAKTCHVHQTSEGSRVDLVLTNHVLAGTCRECDLFKESGLPTHTPVLVSLDTSGVTQEGNCFRTPLAFPMRFQDPDPEAERYQSDEIASACISEHATAFANAIFTWGHRGCISNLLQRW